jgi:GT2 family glycosyltransferase
VAQTLSEKDESNVHPPLLVLSFEYAETIRPCDLEHSSDRRSLAVGFVSLDIECASSGRRIASFRCDGQVSSGLRPLYGLNSSEQWGAWSEGKRTALLLELPEFPASGCRVLIRYEMKRPGPLSVHTRVWVNAVDIGAVWFEGSAGEVILSIAAEDMVKTLSTAVSKKSTDANIEPALTIIILNYNRWDLTFNCVLTVLASATPFTYDIIVVDNGSSDVEHAHLKDLRLPVEIVRLKQRRSFGEANNFAAERARGSKLLFLNNDAFVFRDCIARLADVLNEKETAAVGPIFEYPDGRLQEAGGFINVDGSTVHRNHVNFQGQEESLPPISNVEYASAACLMVRKTDFIKLAGFDPAYEPAYNEDTDLCCRLRALGSTIGLVRDARTIHVLNATLKNLDPDDFLSNAPARGREIFRSRWGNWLWTREADALPCPEHLIFAQEQEESNLSFGADVNAVLTPNDLNENLESHALLALCTALAQRAPTLVGTETAYSRLRLAHLARHFALPWSRIFSSDYRSLENFCIDVFVQSCPEVPPPAQKLGNRRIWYCPMPTRARRLTRVDQHARLEALERIEAVVTTSQLGRQKLLASLHFFGAPELPIEVIHPPVPSVTNVESASKENLIVSVGRFRAGNFGGPQGTVVRAFREFQRMPAHSGWHLICMGRVETQEDLVCFLDLHACAATWPVRFLANPTQQQISAVLARARICISADGLDVSAKREEQAKPQSAIGIGTAIASGCIPLVQAGGVEDEFCREVGVGSALDHVESIPEQLSLIAANCPQNVSVELNRRMSLFSATAFAEKWHRLLDRNRNPIAV